MMGTLGNNYVIDSKVISLLISISEPVSFTTIGIFLFLDVFNTLSFCVVFSRVPNGARGSLTKISLVLSSINVSIYWLSYILP